MQPRPHLMPQTRSKIVASGPPVSSLGSNIQMIQITHINGQMYPPNPNSQRYWLPVRTSDGQEVLRSLSTAPPELPKYEAAPSPIWLQATAPDGRPYWYKEGTQETTWEDPYANNQTVPVQAPPPTVWNQLQTAQGQVYYHNPQTNETAWSLPPGDVASNVASVAPVQQQVVYPAQPQAVYVAQPAAVHHHGPRAPSRELREERLRHARKHGGGMTFW
eukprot:TRINITY_DN22676_c0_g1_i7.p1 TRINITY_DN22676_c0_g1~~TRINITY_DN22676_c0_g1_i7.p1  ORF type:complete len:218 (+),score=43.90 TRINITY_DN22676_c0_g1_i7:179-832(+)